ncbi:MAG TPA: hypothetical protein VNK04_11235 [Gemmataceae bacterium]|jgi:hypothetical protein|nr:hypothetical protein [Gemmataceae bacterium]
MKYRGIRSGPWAVMGLAVTVLVALVGCGSGELSGVHPAKGRVVYKDGDIKLLQGAVVELESVSNPEVAAEGEVQADGTFSISTTSKDGSRTVKGALPGEHRVRIIPPNPKEEAMGMFWSMGRYHPVG